MSFPPNMNLTSTLDPRLHPDNAHLPRINQPATILGLAITCLSCAVTALGFRLFVRIRDKLWGWDDAFVLLAGVASFSGDVIVCLMPGDGLGLHLWTLNYDYLVSYFKHIYASNTSYCSSSTFIKLSILFQYLRLFEESASATTSKQYRLARRVVWVMVALCTVWGLAFTLLALFSCDNIEKNWNIFARGKCIGWGTKDPDQFVGVFLGHAGSNLVLDLMVLAVPVPFLGMLRLAGKSRAGLICLFSLGCVIAGVALGRMIALGRNRAGTVPVPDMSYHTPIIFILGVLEVNLAIIAASIPIFWPMVAALAGNKIFVVNEIEIHVERASRSSFGSDHAINMTDKNEWKGDSKDGKDSFVGRTMSVTTKTSGHRKPPSAHQAHKHKASTASSVGRTAGGGPRSSQESTRNLFKTKSNEHASSTGSLTRDDTNDWFAELDKGENAFPRTTTTVEHTEIPFNYIKPSDNR